MKKLKCYYAHGMHTYNSTIEKQDIELLEKLGFIVENPNQIKHHKGCKEYADKFGNQFVMEYFANIIDKCDIVAFRGLPEGKILSGCAYELNHAIKKNMLIIELPNRIDKRSMTYPETKQYLTELGFYKV